MHFCIKTSRKPSFHSPHGNNPQTVSKLPWQWDTGDSWRPQPTYVMAYPHPYGSDLFQVSAGLFQQGFDQFLHAVLDIHLCVGRKHFQGHSEEIPVVDLLSSPSLFLLKPVRPHLPETALPPASLKIELQRRRSMCFWL